MLTLMFTARSIGREMELQGGCTWMIEGGRRCELVISWFDEVKSSATLLVAGETRGMRMVDLGVFT